MRLAVFRCDAALQIGTGHVMRCLTLADALRERGCECHFVCRAHPGNLLEFIRQRGYKTYALPAPADAGNAPLPDDGSSHAQWLGVSWREDAEQTRAAVGCLQVDWLIVDHYAIDARWEGELRPVCSKLMVLDDLADRDHDCDLLLDQNTLPERNSRYSGRVPQGCELLLGARFVLLRPGFVQLARTRAVRSGPVRRGLIAFAGSDSANLTSAAVEALADSSRHGMVVDVLIGKQHPARGTITRVCATAGQELHVQLDDPAPLMARADLAIAASGFVSYELAAMGVPALLVPISDIQRIVALTLADLGVARVLELPAPDRRTGALRSGWRSMVEDEAARICMSNAGPQLIDAGGTARVVHSMLTVANRKASS